MPLALTRTKTPRAAILSIMLVERWRSFASSRRVYGRSIVVRSLLDAICVTPYAREGGCVCRWPFCAAHHSRTSRKSFCVSRFLGMLPNRNARLRRQPCNPCHGRSGFVNGKAPYVTHAAYYPKFHLRSQWGDFVTLKTARGLCRQ